jgi:hypothetical protein
MVRGEFLARLIWEEMRKGKKKRIPDRVPLREQEYVVVA